MSEVPIESSEAQPQSPPPARAEGESLDPAGQALADALQISFKLLKLVMIVILGIFVVSGFFKVEQNEQVLILRFGQVRGDEGQAIKTEGLHWKWPSPIDEVVRIPSSQALQILSVDEAFWYHQTEQEKLGLQQTNPTPSLQFVRDGYCLTASKSVATLSLGPSNQNEAFQMTDYNLIHSQWEIRYTISDPVAFFEQLWSGHAEDWGQVEDFLRSKLADVVIVTSANRDINEILYGVGREAYREEVEAKLRGRLGELNTGLSIEKLILGENITPPRYVVSSFEAAQSASSHQKILIAGAQAQADEVISQARADANNRLAQADAYRMRIEQSAEADAKVIDLMLDKIEEIAKEKVPSETAEGLRQRQKISEALLAIAVNQKYQEMLGDVISNADETFVLSSHGGLMELRLMLSRSAFIRKKSGSDDEDEN
ncbi:MAG: hypothetical protein IID32_02540 [Planctomycetes bacterium]|nr:hypothetical protein [Planctomycetota bacterium]